MVKGAALPYPREPDPRLPENVLLPLTRIVVAVALVGVCASVHDAAMSATPSLKHVTACNNNVAAGYACSSVDLAAQVDLAALGAASGQEGNDVWGWTDSSNGREYALMGVGNGTAFVDITLPDHPLVLGLLPTHAGNSLWRDIKVYADHAFIVSEAVGHGMQVFNLARLRNVVSPPQTFTEDAHYPGFGRAHNIVINEDTGFAYAVGSRQGATTCAGGLHMIDVSTPLSPQFAGCFSADGYTHDAQCVLYNGPDTNFTGHEICFNSNEDTLTIVDVSNKAAPVQIARVGYPGSAYTHQGWLVPGQRWYLMDDELDELDNNHNTRTYVWDLSELTSPVRSFAYTGQLPSTDHNLYVRDQYAFLANYKSGLRILDLSGIEQQQVREVGYFDTYPADDASGFDGAWSSYPFFDSGTVIVSDISRGLFVLRPNLCQTPEPATAVSAVGAGDNAIDLSWNASATVDASYEVYRELGGCGNGPGELIASGLTLPTLLDSSASGQVDYGYRVRVVAPGAQCSSPFSACALASTSGICSAPPLFAGLQSASTPAQSRCAVDLGWSAATPSCTGPATFELHRSTDADFLPAPENLIRQIAAGGSYRDHDVQTGQTYHYVMRARDVDNKAVDSNLVRRSASPLGEVGKGTWSNGAEEGEPFLGAGGVVPLHVAWHAVDDQFHTGARSYVSGYVNSDCVALTTPAIDLGGGSASTLNFFHRYGIEDGWDGGRIEISVDGLNWTPIAPVGGYPQQITNAGNGCGWPVGTGVYAGTALAWHGQSVNLALFSGPVYLRWVFSTDISAAEEGWWIDTITVSPARVNGVCSTIPTLSALTLSANQGVATVIGNPVPIEFSVQGTPPGDGTPGGTVIVSVDGGAEQCSAVLPAMSCDLVLDRVGVHPLTATYGGDAVFPGANSSTTHEVLAAEATLQLSVIGPAPSPAGDVQVMISLGGIDGLPSPGGSIDVHSDLDPAGGCSVLLPATGCTLVLQAVGLHRLTADYSGDARYAPSSAATAHQVFVSFDVFADGFE